MGRKNSSWIVFGAVAVILLFAAGVAHHTSISRSEINLLSPTDWSHFPGASNTGKGIHFSPMGRVLTHKDTSAAGFNPPVNVRGSHLSVSGSWQIEALISGVDNGAAIQLYGQVPIIYDEWRQERGSVRVEATSYGLSVRVWDGTSPTSIDERIFRLSLKNDVKITLIHHADQIFLRAGNKTLGSMPDHGIFALGTVWFGADANPGSDGWTLNSVRARALVKGRVKIVPPPKLNAAHKEPDTLRNLEHNNPRHLLIGVAASAYPLFTDEQYAKITLGQFSLMTPENSMKPQSIHPQKNLYVYQDADSLVEAALQNQMLVHGHALILGKANPRWMEKTPERQRKQAMTDHIKNVVGHYKGKVASWDVVNEPLSEDDIDYNNGRLGLRKQMWFDAMGESYIDASFRTAHSADPAAKLYLNDYGLEKDGTRWKAMVSLIQRLQARGVPIDGIGFEAHVYKESDAINPAVLQRHIQILAAMGVASRISEIDVLGDDPTLQARQYSDILQVCMHEPTCTSYTTWGVTDLYGSTTISDRYPIKFGKSLLWDENYRPKSAVTSLQNVLKR